MGARVVLPEPDSNMQKALKTFMFTPDEIALLVKPFNKIDKAKTGLVKMEDLLSSCELGRSIYTDALLELFGIELSDGDINFCDFFTLVVNYCFFEPPEILRFCLYMFDQDKAGFMNTEEVKSLMNILHNVEAPGTVRGNVKISWGLIQVDMDDRVDYKELVEMHNAFPRLFEPAFMIQERFMIHFCGRSWWRKKKLRLQDWKALADAKLKKNKEQEAEEKERRRVRKIKRDMGLLRYYCCPWKRALFDPSHMEVLSEQEKKRRDEELKLMRRKADLRAKNPETAQWEKYQKKVEPSKGGKERYIVEKIDETAIGRTKRGAERAKRKNNRKKQGEFSDF